MHHCQTMLSWAVSIKPSATDPSLHRTDESAPGNTELRHFGAWPSRTSRGRRDLPLGPRDKPRSSALRQRAAWEATGTQGNGVQLRGSFPEGLMPELTCDKEGSRRINEEHGKG